MTANYYPIDPAFQGRNYPENGTIGYNGKGWYYFHGGQLWGPFNNEEEAITKEKELFNKEKNQ